MNSPLRSRLIRLAHSKPELRPQLLPLLKKAESYAGIKSSDTIGGLFRDLESNISELVRRDFAKDPWLKEFKITYKGGVVYGWADTYGFEMVLEDFSILSRQWYFGVEIRLLVPDENRASGKYKERTSGGWDDHSTVYKKIDLDLGSSIEMVSLYVWSEVGKALRRAGLR